MKDLHEQLTKSWRKKRFGLPTLQRSLRLLISDITKTSICYIETDLALDKNTTCHLPNKKT